MYKTLIAILCSLLLSSCTIDTTLEKGAHALSATGLSSRHSYTRLRTVALSPVDSIYLPISSNRFREPLRRRLAEDSGIVLNEYFVTVVPGREPETVASALRSAQELNCGLMFYAQIAQYEDQFSSFAEVDGDSGDVSTVGFDRLQLQITIWDVNRSTVIDKAILSSRSGWLEWQSKQPDSLIQSALFQYLEQLVARL